MIRELIAELLSKNFDNIIEEKTISLIELLLNDEQVLESCDREELYTFLYLIGRENISKYEKMLMQELYLKLTRLFLNRSEQEQKPEDNDKFFPEIFDKIDGKYRVKDSKYYASNFFYKINNGETEYCFTVDENGYLIDYSVYNTGLENVDYDEIYAELSDDLLKYQDRENELS